MRRSLHQGLCLSIVYLYWVCGWTALYTLRYASVMSTDRRTYMAVSPRQDIQAVLLLLLFCFVFYDFLPVVLFCLVLFVSWFFLGPLLVPCFFGLLISSKHTFMYYKAVHPPTLNIDTLYSNIGLDVQISSNTLPHNYINNLKCVEWQRPDDGHYRPKHVVFWRRI